REASMNIEFAAGFRRVGLRRWLSLPLSAALGGLLLLALFAGLQARSAAAAGADDPAVLYPCSEGGLDAAPAAGGRARLACGAALTVTVTTLKTVPHNLTLDGANKLILSAANLTGVFSVPAGIHLSLLNLTLRDAKTHMYGGAVINRGTLNVSSTSFISNS